MLGSRDRNQKRGRDDENPFGDGNTNVQQIATAFDVAEFAKNASADSSNQLLQLVQAMFKEPMQSMYISSGEYASTVMVKQTIYNVIKPTEGYTMLILLRPSWGVSNVTVWRSIANLHTVNIAAGTFAQTANAVPLFLRWIQDAFIPDAGQVIKTSPPMPPNFTLGRNINFRFSAISDATNATSNVLTGSFSYGKLPDNRIEDYSGAALVQASESEKDGACGISAECGCVLMQGPVFSSLAPVNRTLYTTGQGEAAIARNVLGAGQEMLFNNVQVDYVGPPPAAYAMDATVGSYAKLLLDVAAGDLSSVLTNAVCIGHSSELGWQRPDAFPVRNIKIDNIGWQNAPTFKITLQLPLSSGSAKTLSQVAGGYAAATVTIPGLTLSHSVTGPTATTLDFSTGQMVAVGGGGTSGVVDVSAFNAAHPSSAGPVDTRLDVLLPTLTGAVVGGTYESREYDRVGWLSVLAVHMYAQADGASEAVTYTQEVLEVPSCHASGTVAQYQVPQMYDETGTIQPSVPAAGTCFMGATGNFELQCKAPYREGWSWQNTFIVGIDPTIYPIPQNAGVQRGNYPNVPWFGRVMTAGGTSGTLGTRGEAYPWFRVADAAKLALFQPRIVSIAVVIDNLYDRGNTTDTRILLLQDMAAGQSIRVQGEFLTECVSTTAIAPFQKQGTDGIYITDQTAVDVARQIWMAPNSIFRSNYTTDQWRMVKSLVNDMTTLQQLIASEVMRNPAAARVAQASGSFMSLLGNIAGTAVGGMLGGPAGAALGASLGGAAGGAAGGLIGMTGQFGAQGEFGAAGMFGDEDSDDDDDGADDDGDEDSGADEAKHVFGLKTYGGKNGAKFGYIKWRRGAGPGLQNGIFFNAQDVRRWARNRGMDATPEAFVTVSNGAGLSANIPVYAERQLRQITDQRCGRIMTRSGMSEFLDTQPGLSAKNKLTLLNRFSIWGHTEDPFTAMFTRFKRYQKHPEQLAELVPYCFVGGRVAMSNVGVAGQSPEQILWSGPAYLADRAAFVATNTARADAWKARYFRAGPDGKPQYVPGGVEVRGGAMPAARRARGQQREAPVMNDYDDDEAAGANQVDPRDYQAYNEPQHREPPPPTHGPASPLLSLRPARAAARSAAASAAPATRAASVAAPASYASPEEHEFMVRALKRNTAGPSSTARVLAEHAAIADREARTAFRTSAVRGKGAKARLSTAGRYSL